MTKIAIGIDTGVNTGFAVWNITTKSFLEICTVDIVVAMDKVRFHAIDYSISIVRVEDARLRKWIPPGAGREVLQGVGSVKRDAAIWESFLKMRSIPFELVAPKNNKTKSSDAEFKLLTKWPNKTNEHGRDAAMLVFGWK